MAARAWPVGTLATAAPPGWRRGAAMGKEEKTHQDERPIGPVVRRTS